MKKIISCLLIICLFLTLSVSAEEKAFTVSVAYDRNESTINVSGTVKYDGTVTLILVKPGTDIESLASGAVQFKDVAVTADEAVSSNGIFTFDEIPLSPKLKAGDYILRVASDGEAYQETISIASAAQAVEAIKEATTADEVLKLIESYNDIYGLEISKDSLFEKIGESGKKETAKRIADGNPETKADLKNLFDKSNALYKIYLGPWTAIEDILDKYSSVLDIEDVDITKAYDESDVYKAITGNLYDSEEELKSDLESAIAESKAPTSDRGNSGGGSGSGLSGGKAHLTPSVPETNEPEQVVKTGFADLDGYEWAEESINKLASSGIVNGRDEKTFAPGDFVTREEAIKMIILTFDMLDNGAEADFDDVAKSDWSYPYVASGAENGIINGYSENYFGKNDYVTRQDIAVMIYRAAQKVGIELATGAEVEFSDEDKISDYSKEAVFALSKAGIINGSDGNFLPDSPANRAQTAKMLAGFLK